MEIQPRQRRYTADVLRGHYIPMVNGAAREVQVSGENRLTAGAPNGFISGSARKIVEVHAGNVEEFSPIFNPNRRDILDIHGARIRAAFLPMSESKHKFDVGNRLRLVREALGYGLREFARLHDVDHTKLNHWEKGRHYPDPAFIRLLWEKHHVTADWIYLDQVAGLPSALAVNLDAAVRADRADRPGLESPELEVVGSSAAPPPRRGRKPTVNKT